MARRVIHVERGSSYTVDRTARIDLRLTPSEKAKLEAKAKAKRRTVTSVMLELIENIDKIIP